MDLGNNVYDYLKCVHKINTFFTSVAATLYDRPAKSNKNTNYVNHFPFFRKCIIVKVMWLCHCIKLTGTFERNEKIQLIDPKLFNKLNIIKSNHFVINKMKFELT